LSGLQFSLGEKIENIPSFAKQTPGTKILSLVRWKKRAPSKIFKKFIGSLIS
jgi:hypothetical protein